MGKGSPENMRRLEAFVADAIKLLVDDEDCVDVLSTSVRSGQRVVIEVFVGSPLGQVLGRGGRNLDAVRVLVRAYCAKVKGPHVTVELVEAQDGNKKPPEFFSIDMSDVQDEDRQPAHHSFRPHSGRFA